MKRFTETQKWEDPWFRKLKPEMKLLWQWILDRCDNAGVIDPDLELASFQIGYAYPMDTLLQFGERVAKLPCGKWFIPKFIGFQYGKISTDCRAHNPIFQSLEKHQIKGYSKGIHTLQEKEKEKDSDSSLQTREETEPLCTLSQAKSYAPTVRFSEAEVEHWWNTRNATDWTKSAAGGGHARKITSWQSDMATSASWVKQALTDSKSKRKPSVGENFTSDQVGI